jgi:phosphatidylglycerophosphate synthase
VIGRSERRGGGEVTTSDRVDRRVIVARLAQAQKSNRGAGGYSRWVNRRVGRQFAAVAFLAGLRPNQVSAISAVFTFSSIAALGTLQPTWWSAVLITAGLLVGYAFDSADGQVARLQGGGSPAGEWLDHVLDSLKAATFHLAIAVMWFRFYDLDHAAYLLIPLAYSAVSSVFFFAMILSDMLRRVERVKVGGSGVTTSSLNPNEAAPILRSLIVLPNDYGVLCLCLLLIALHSTFQVVYTVLLAANALFLLAGSYRWFREMGRLREVTVATATVN